MNRPSKPQSTTMFIMRASSTGFPFFDDMRFTSFSGVKDETNTITYVSPFLHREFTIPTYRVYEKVTLTLPYNAQDHKKIFSYWNSYQNQTLQIKIEPVVGCQVDGEEKSLGYEIQLDGCLWLGVHGGIANRLENQISDLTLTFSFVRARENLI